MPRYLLDTNIISFNLKQSHPLLDHRVQLTPSHELTTSSIVEAELRYGAARLPATARIHALLADFLPRIEILAWDSRCAAAFALLRRNLEIAGRSLSLADAMIAAHALVYNLTLVTNDQAFHNVESLPLEDWTKAPTATRS